MAIQTVLHIVTVTLLVTLFVKSEPQNDRRVQTKMYMRTIHFPRQPLKIPYKKFKKYKEYDPFTFQNKWTPIGPPTDPNKTPIGAPTDPHKTPNGPPTDPESERRQPKLPNDDNLVLDFSSGSAKMVPNTATNVKIVSAEDGSGAFSTFRALIKKVDITQELKMAGNVTIFSPLNEAFDKLPIKIENQSLSSRRRLILRHFVKGFLFKRDMENGTIRTLGGELVRIVRQENNVKFLTKSTEANLRASNIETAFGLVQVIDSVLI